MKARQAARLLAAHLEQPLEVWPAFDVGRVPFAIYDEREIVYLNHPSPPAEKPSLHAATRMKIGGVEAAIVPANFVKDEAGLVSLAYHEAFHVYQEDGGFEPGPGFDFFAALAYYPELDADYMALCMLEESLYNSATRPLEEKSAVLAAAIRARRSILSHNEGARLLDDYSERNEGTASYIEHRVAREIFGKSYPQVSGGSNRVRAYVTGAALGRLLDDLGVSWKRRVESGMTPSDVLLDVFTDEVDLDSYDLISLRRIAHDNVRKLRSEVEHALTEAFSAGALIIVLPPHVEVRRAFNPQHITSLGDGKLVYRGLRIDLPNGFANLSGNVLALEDLPAGTLTFPVFDYELKDGHLLASGPEVEIELRPVIKEKDHTYRLLTAAKP